MKHRTKVPAGRAADVMFTVDRRCCMCDPVAGGLPPRLLKGQIHHLDEDPSRHDQANLVWLCLDHHEEAGTRGKSARRFSWDLIRRYRGDLEMRVRRHRAVVEIRKAHPKDEAIFVGALDALVVLDLGKLQVRTGRDWKAIDAALSEMHAYPEALGFTAKEAIMEYLAKLASGARNRMPASVSREIRSLTMVTSGLDRLGGRRTRKSSKTDLLLWRIAAEVGSSLVYDGSLYLQDVEVVESGAEILWRLLSLATVTKNAAVRKAALEGFDAGLDGAKRGNQPDAETLLVAFRDYGLAGGTAYPELSKELIFRLYDHRQEKKTNS